MEKFFDVLFLSDALDFLERLDKKHAEKILYNIRKAQVERDADLFKKLSGDIWEFRTLFQGHQYRLLAFWNKTDNKNTLVISTHGFVKKRSDVPENEINKAAQMRIKYFNEKS
jgi:phage-related protein